MISEFAWMGRGPLRRAFRVVDFDDRPISKTPERQEFGGGSTPDWTNQSPPVNTCGAAHGWAMSPQR